MFPLKQRLAEYGFESHEDYDFAIQCLLNNPTPNIRCLNIDGDPGRRKTAFAHALGQAMQVEHLLYFEFGVEAPIQPVVRVVDGEEIPEEPPTQPFDRIMTEACALSEAEKTILILDQLHLAKFQQHIRLYEFTKSKIWSYSDVSFHANPANLILFIISSEPLYHSLQQASFRVWVCAEASSAQALQPADLGLDESCREWLDAFNELMAELGHTPTRSEYQRIAHDVLEVIRTEEQLCTSIFGWVEDIDRKRLHSKPIKPYISKVMRAIENSLNVHEEIEITSNE